MSATQGGGEAHDRPAVDPQRAALYLRVLGGDVAAAHVWFDERVLDRYRDQASFRVLRSNTVGRVQATGGWSLDFGIAGEVDTLIHATAGDLVQRLPVAERQHWAQHVITPPVSRTFVSMRLAPGACFDDGDVRPWTR